MFGFIRNAAVIGAIAYFSPVHDATPPAQFDALRAAPSQMIGDTLRTGPALALAAAANLDPASRDALARKIVQMALQPDTERTATRSR